MKKPMKAKKIVGNGQLKRSVTKYFNIHEAKPKKKTEICKFLIIFFQ